MPGAGGEEVGRISIRVVPDLDKFREKLKAELEYWDKKTVTIKVRADTAEAKAKMQNVAKDLTAEVKAKANTRGVREQMKAATSGVTAKVDVDVEQTSIDRFQARMLGKLKKAFSSIEPKLDLDVSGEELRRQYEKIEAQIEKSIRLKIPTEVEEAAVLRQKVDRLVAKAEALNKSVIPIKVKLDEKSTFYLNKRLEELARKRGVIIKPRLDFDEKANYEFQKRLDALDRKNLIKVGIDFDEKASFELQKRLDQMRADSLRKTLDAIDKANIQGMKDRGNFPGRPLSDDTVRARLELDTAVAELQRMAWVARAEADKINQKVEIDPDLTGLARWKAKVEATIANINFNKRSKSLSAADLLPDISGVAEEAGKGLAKVGVGAAGSLPSLLSFGSVLVIIAAAIAIILPPLLALGVGFLSLTPALLAFAAPLGAVALGLDGIKKAAERAGLFADENGAKKGGGTVGAALDAIKQKVSDTFENALFPAFDKLGTLFNNSGFQNALAGVAQGLSDMASGFIDAVTSSTGMANINSIVSNISTGLTNAAPGVRDFTEAILELVEGISQKFPGLGTWFSELMAGFKADMVDFTKPGEDGMSRLDHLIANVRSGIEGLTGVFQAFWNQGLKDIQDPNFGKSMLNFFDGVKSFVTNTLPVLTEGFKSLADALKALEPVFKGIGLLGNLAQLTANPGAAGNDFISRLRKDGKWNWSDAFFTVSNADAQKAQEAGREAAKNTQEGFTQGMRDLFSGGAAANPANAGLVGSLTDPTQLLKAQIAGQQVGGQVTDGITAALNGQGASEVVSSLQGVVTQAQQTTDQIGPQLSQSIVTALTPLQELPGKVMTSFQGVGAAVNGSFSLVVSQVFTMAQQVATSLSSVFVQIPGLIIQAMSGAASAAATGGSQIVIGITTPLTQLGGIFTSVFSNLVGVVKDSMGQLVQAITTGAQQAVQTVSAIPGQMAGSISAGAGALVGPGQALMAGLKQGIVSGLQDILAYASTIAAQIAAVKGPLPKDRKELIPAGEALMEGLGTGMESGFEDVLTRTKAMAKAIFEAMKEVFGSASGANFNFNLGGAVGQTAEIASNAKAFSNSMGTAIQPTKPGKIDAETQSMIDQLKVQKEALDVDRARLQADKNLTSDKGQKAVIQQQLDQLQVQKQSLEAQIAQLNYQGKYANSVGETKDLWEGMNEKIVNGISSVGQGVVQSYASDLGISGNGMLSTLAQTGLQWGSQFVFNVSNIDEAMSVQQMQQNKQTTGIVGRV